MKVKIGQEVYVDGIYEIPGGLGKVSGIETKKSVYRKNSLLITIEEVPAVQYTWTNHLEKCQPTLKKIYGKQRAGVKNEPVK